MGQRHGWVVDVPVVLHIMEILRDAPLGTVHELPDQGRVDPVLQHPFVGDWNSRGAVSPWMTFKPCQIPSTVSLVWPGRPGIGMPPSGVRYKSPRVET